MIQALTHSDRDICPDERIVQLSHVILSPWSAVRQMALQSSRARWRKPLNLAALPSHAESPSVLLPRHQSSVSQVSVSQVPAQASFTLRLLLSTSLLLRTAGTHAQNRQGFRVCSRISAALSCDTVKTRFSGSGGAGRSPARKFYGQALFSRQNLHAIRPTAPRWIALIETCTKHAKQGECGAARGLQERTCLRNAVATAMDARSCGSSRPDAKHSSSTAALVQYACTRKTRTAPPCSHAGQGRCALQ